MKEASIPTKGGVFRAKLRHYHRSASPEFFSRKRKRWEEVSQQDFGDADSSYKGKSESPLAEKVADGRN